MKESKENRSSRSHYRRIILDELVDIYRERLAEPYVLIRQKERVTKAYNKNVKLKTFFVGNLVLKPMDRKDINLGKWSLN